MSKKRLDFCILSFLLLLSAPLAQAQSEAPTPTRVYFSTFGLGFGARAMGMGGAFIAIADDITAMSYNPAGLAQLNKLEFSLGIRFGAQSLTYSGINETFESSSPPTRISYDPYTASFYRFGWDYLGAVVPFRIARMPVVLGISRSVKGSDRAEYGYLHHYDEFVLPEDSARSEKYERTNVDNRGSMTVTSFSVNIRPFDFLHLGYNLNIWNENALLQYDYENEFIRYDPVTDPVITRTQQTINEKIQNGINHDFGILAKFRYFSAGFVYKTAFNADFQSIEDSSEFRGTVHWPYSLGLGVSVHPTETLYLSADYNFANWSDGRVVSEDDSTVRAFPETPTSPTNPTSAPSDTEQIRLGAEYLILKQGMVIPLRVGGFLNKLFFKDGRNETVRYNGLTCGTGLALKSLTIDFAAIYNFGSYDFPKPVGSKMLYIPTKEASWELLMSISYRFSI